MWWWFYCNVHNHEWFLTVHIFLSQGIGSPPSCRISATRSNSKHCPCLDHPICFQPPSCWTVKFVFAYRLNKPIPSPYGDQIMYYVTMAKSRFVTWPSYLGSGMQVVLKPALIPPAWSRHLFSVCHRDISHTPTQARLRHGNYHELSQLTPEFCPSHHQNSRQLMTWRWLRCHAGFIRSSTLVQANVPSSSSMGRPCILLPTLFKTILFSIISKVLAGVLKKIIVCNCLQGFEHIELPEKLLHYFLRSNKSNINQLNLCKNISLTILLHKNWLITNRDDGIKTILRSTLRRRRLQLFKSKAVNFKMRRNTETSNKFLSLAAVHGSQKRRNFLS